MRHVRRAGLAMLALAFSTSTAFAQRSVNTGAGAGGGGFWEFGVDFVGIYFGMDDPSTTSLGFGSGALRAGKFIADNMSIEPVVGFGYNSTSGGSSSNSLSVEGAFLYHLQSDRTKQMVFIRPALVFSRFGFKPPTGASSSSNQMGIMVGAGIKRPSKKNARFTWRGEVRFTNMLKTDTQPSSSMLSLLGGVSVYSK